MPPKSKIPKGKKEFSVLISEKTYRMVAELAPKIFGKHRGALSEAAEEALRLWVETHTKAHIKTNPPTSIRETYNKVVNELRKMHGIVRTHVSKIDFIKALQKVVRATDQRTQRKWLHTFYIHGFIKPLGLKVYNERSWKNVVAIEIVAKQV